MFKSYFLTLFFTYDKNLLTVLSTFYHTYHVQPRQFNNLPHSRTPYSTSHPDRLPARFTRFRHYHASYPCHRSNPFLSPFQLILKLSLSTSQSTSRPSSPFDPSTHHLLLRPVPPSPDMPHGYIPQDQGEEWIPIHLCDLQTAGVGKDAPKDLRADQSGPGKEMDQRMERMYAAARRSRNLLNTKIPGRGDAL